MMEFTVFVKIKIFIKCSCHETSSPKKLERFTGYENHTKNDTQKYWKSPKIIVLCFQVLGKKEHISILDLLLSLD